MIFINTSMFTGDIHIPNLEESCIQDFEIFKLLAKWERECLEFVLGKCLFDQLMDQMEIKTSDSAGKYYALKDDVEQKWKWLVNGRTYQKTDESVSNFEDLSVCGCGCSSGDCEFHDWEGFVTTTPTIVNGEEMEFKDSFIAYYVYFMWCFNNQSRTTGTGEQKPKSKNSEPETNHFKRVDAWNCFFAKVAACASNGRVGLNGFIREHSESFANANCAKIKPLNYWDV